MVDTTVSAQNATDGPTRGSGRCGDYYVIILVVEIWVEITLSAA